MSIDVTMIASTTTYTFKSPSDISSVVGAILRDYPYLEDAELTISEMMINAVEHGNLGITYEEKSRLLETDDVMGEVERRLNDPTYQDKKGFVEIKEFDDETVVFICDEGKGFAWKDYLDKDLSTIKGLHGRGISLSLKFCKTLTYIGNGNKVVVVFDRPRT